MNAKERKTKRIFLFVVFCLLFTAVITFITTPRSGPIVSPIPDDPKTTQAPIFHVFSTKKDKTELKRKIQEAVQNTWDNYSVYVVDYSSDFSVSINETEVFAAASVNKIPIMAALYEEAGKGNVDFDKQITIQAADVQDYGTGSIRYDPPGSTYSIKTLARLMMQKSDNTAAYVLANYVVGLSKIQSLVTGWGLTQTDMIDNKTSNKDMELLMDKIYTGKIANAAMTQEMLGFMKDSDFEDRIPALLPSDTTIYHKIGTTEGGIHDVGIVINDKTKYYIGIFTADIVNEEEAVLLLAKISKVVFDYLD